MQVPCLKTLPVVSALFLGTNLFAQDEDFLFAPPRTEAISGLSNDVNWATGQGVNLGGVLFPHVHIDSVVGGSTGDQGRLAVGHHDPSDDGFTLQAVEVALSGRFGEYLEGYANYAGVVTADDEWEDEFEEWFLKAKNIPGGFELRGGRFYNRFGIQNSFHAHGFDFVDQTLANGRLIGEDPLTTIGGAVTWNLPTPWRSQLDVAVGVAPEGHDHDHGEDDHGHGHAGEEAEFEVEGAGFRDDEVLTVVNWTNVYNYNDFHQYRGGVSGAWGDNTSNGSTELYGLHFEYQWRENGFEPGGQALRWRTEAYWRQWDGEAAHEDEHHDEHGDEDHHDEHGEEDHHDDHDDDHDEDHDEHEEDHGGERGSFTDFGIYTSVIYSLNPNWDFGLRCDYVTDEPMAGLDERFRVSPSITYYLNQARTLRFRLQYNYDHSSVYGDDHSVWGQVSFAWGGAEVR